MFRYLVSHYGIFEMWQVFYIAGLTYIHYLFFISMSLELDLRYLTIPFFALVLEVLMTYVPVFLAFIATRIIRIKTESETDHFVLFWNSVYRTWNIFMVIVSGSLFAILNAIVEDPQLLFNLITQGIFYSSQFFFDNVIFATGTGLFYEFCQLPTVISFFFKKKLMHEASSQRELDKLEETSKFDWGDCLPEFLFIFMVAQLYW